MRPFLAFFKKELMENNRTGKLIILTSIFVAFGIMNPLIALITPWLLEIFSNSLSDSGMIISDIEVNALTSWAQFYKNMPIALIVFVIIYSSTFTNEYEKNTLQLLVSKGLSRSKILLAKLSNLFILWTIGYFLCFLITYVYNAYYWDNSIAVGLLESTLMWYIFGLFIISLIIFLSTLVNKTSNVLLFLGFILLVIYLLSLVPLISEFMPTSLMHINEIIIGVNDSKNHLYTMIISILGSIILILTSIPFFNKKNL